MPSKIKTNGTVGVSLPKKERKILILKQVNIHTRLMFNDLVNLIDVSEDTIRRDVNELAEEGQVIRIKGGVMSAAYHIGHDSEAYAQSNKLIIAEKAGIHYLITELPPDSTDLQAYRSKDLTIL